VADRRHDQPAGERFDDQPVQYVAVDVAAHTPGAVATRQKQRIDVIERCRRPTHRILVLG
jgi:hypothetical protein